MSVEVEEWRAVVGWEGLYEVSSLGRVRSLDRIVSSNSGGARRQYFRAGQILRPGHQYGYKFVALYCPGVKKKVARIAHLVACAFLGPRPNGMEVAHSDGDSGNDRSTNLRYATRIENEQDKLGHGTRPIGEKHPGHKLTAADVRHIRELWPSLSYAQLADKFGVHKITIADAVTRRSWRHLP